MADEYVATTEQVRAVWAAWAEYGGLTNAPSGHTDDHLAAFDRWLAAHDAEIREQTLAPIRAALDGHPVCDSRPDDDYPSCGWKRAVADVRAALDA